jgi:hypothetical protein
MFVFKILIFEQPFRVNVARRQGIFVAAGAADGAHEGRRIEARIIGLPARIEKALPDIFHNHLVTVSAAGTVEVHSFTENNIHFTSSEARPRPLLQKIMSKRTEILQTARKK